MSARCKQNERVSTINHLPAPLQSLERLQKQFCRTLKVPSLAVYKRSWIFPPSSTKKCDCVEHVRSGWWWWSQVIVNTNLPASKLSWHSLVSQCPSYPDTWPREWAGKCLDQNCIELAVLRMANDECRLQPSLGLVDRLHPYFVPWELECDQCACNFIVHLDNLLCIFACQHILVCLELLHWCFIRLSKWRDHVMLPATGGRFRAIGGSCFNFSYSCCVFSSSRP